MNIVIDARIINSSTGRYVERLLHYLQDVDTTNQYTVLVPSKDKEYWTPKKPNFTVQTVNFLNYSFAEQIGFKRFLDKLKPDLVHFCMPQQPILYTGAHVTTFHDLTLLLTYNSDKNWLIFHAKQFVGKFVFKRVARTSQHIITPSMYTKRGVAAFAKIPESKITVTYESADQSTVQPIPYNLPYEKYLLYVGSQSDYKNIRRLGVAHQKLLQSYPDLGLVLVGSKNKSALANEGYFTKRGYRNITYTGFANDGQLEWLYKHSAAYVFPSLMEGFGLPGLEAMTYGAPVVSSKATCLPEVYGDAAHYFNPKDTTDMVQAIDRVLRDDMYRAALIEKGYEQIKKYSWETMAKQTHAVYMQVLTKTLTTTSEQ